jgi:hypothetical protein
MTVGHQLCGLVTWRCPLGFDVVKTSDKCVFLASNFAMY